MIAADKQRQGTREALSALRRQFQQQQSHGQHKAWLLPGGAGAALGGGGAAAAASGPLAPAGSGGAAGAFAQACGTTLCFARYRSDDAVRLLEEGGIFFRVFFLRFGLFFVARGASSRRSRFQLLLHRAADLAHIPPPQHHNYPAELAALDARLDSLRAEQKRLTARLADLGAAPRTGAALDAHVRLKG